MRFRVLFSVVVSGLMVGFFLSSCQSDEGKKKTRLARREALASQYCGSCHLPVSPSMLDKKTWKEHVLPAMAEKLGVGVWRGPAYYEKQSATIPLNDWQEIVTYFDSLAPVTLTREAVKVQRVEAWEQFELKKPGGIFQLISTTTMVHFDTLNHSLFTSDASSDQLNQWNNALEDIFSLKLPSPAVAMQTKVDKRSVLTLIGDMKAKDNPLGSVWSLGENGKLAEKEIAGGFIRPIQTVVGDFNKDGSDDYLVSSFGHNRGGLYLLTAQKDGSFLRSSVREVPGATHSIVRDFNGDGWPDIMSLFAHGDEGIWLFLNDTRGGFSERNLLRFPPVYGSSSFEYVDLDGDGKEEIIYTSGDNSDYSKILKPYHGLYIFSDTGDMKFEQRYFYPVNGATKAMAADFDKDGHMDIALIAFFADLKNNPSETFTIFKQEKGASKGFEFRPIAVPIYKDGRWICMDVADFDGDGDSDIVLGSYSKGFLNQLPFQPDWNTKLPFIVLKNNFVKQ